MLALFLVMKNVLHLLKFSRLVRASPAVHLTLKTLFNSANVRIKYKTFLWHQAINDVRGTWLINDAEDIKTSKDFHIFGI